ncbi:MAG: FHA domain-containing protein [Myxococcales bacterium]|nr:FHA domain-containing protein [Myxococcales bacterium]
MVRCAQCDRENHDGSAFCQQCGKPLVAVCPACAEPNAQAMNFCRRCGNALHAPAPPAHVKCGACGALTPVGFRFCQGCGGTLVAPATLGPAQERSLTPVPGAPLAASFTPPPAAVAAPFVSAETRSLRPLLERLVVLERDGSDGASHALVGDTCIVGRAGVDICFPADTFLAERHAVLERNAGARRVRALDEVNGVFLRIARPVQLVGGDRLLAGQQLFRFELLDSDEWSARGLVQHGVAVLGSRPPPAWARLVQLTGSGVARDVHHLHRPETVVGREEGELRFPDDGFLSRAHFAIAHGGGAPMLRDLGSSNGTFVRLRTEQPLSSGDFLRLGDQLLRYEKL